MHAIKPQLVLVVVCIITSRGMNSIELTSEAMDLAVGKRVDILIRTGEEWNSGRVMVVVIIRDFGVTIMSGSGML